MSNPLHDLGDVFHRFGEEIKKLADKVEEAFKADEKPMEQGAEHVAMQVAEATVKTAESAVAAEAEKKA